MSSSQTPQCSFSRHSSFRTFWCIHRKIHKLVWWFLTRGFLSRGWLCFYIGLSGPKVAKMFKHCLFLCQRNLPWRCNLSMEGIHRFWKVRGGRRTGHGYRHRWWLEMILWQCWVLRGGFTWLVRRVFGWCFIGFFHPFWVTQLFIRCSFWFPCLKYYQCRFCI